MPLLTKIRVMAAKVEATLGTKETLAAGDGAFNFYDVKISPDIPVEERQGQGGFNMLPGVAGARKGKVTCKTDIAYDGVSIPAWASTLLPACGWIDNAGTFNPKSQAISTTSDVKSLTIGVWEGEDSSNAVLKQIYGAVGTFKVMLEAGKMAFIEWEFEGVWEPPIDEALILPTYPTALPARFADSATSFDGTDICVAKVEIDAANKIVMRQCPDTVQGYESGIITHRYPTISIDPEATLVADDDPYGDLIANTEGIFTTQLKTAGTSTIDFTAPKAQIFEIDEADRDDLQTDEIKLMCNKNGATHDEELSITFTAS